MNKAFFFIVSIITGCLILISCARQENSIQTVQSVDLSKYLGKWHEIARLPNHFQKQCISDVTAEYALSKNKKWVQVTNSCINKNKKLEQAIARAYIVDAKTNAKIKVNFLPVFLHWLNIGFGNYWILDLGKNYEYALVGDPTLKYLWVLSRTNKMDVYTYHQLLQKAKQLGFDVDKMVLTKQTNF